MKLLQVTHSLNPSMGGVAQAVKSMAIVLEAKHFPCEILTLDPPGVEYIESKHTTVYNLGPSGGFGKHSRSVVPWLKLNVLRFDVIIINGLWGYHGYAVWRVIKDLKSGNKTKNTPRVFVMPHGMLDPYFQRARDRRFKALRNRVYWSLIEKHVVNDANGLLFTCKSELLLARETFNKYRPRREYNIGFGIEDPPPREKTMASLLGKHDGIPSEPYLLFLGRIDKKKGVDLLVQAYIALCKWFDLRKEKPPKLVIAGPGMESELGIKLQQEIAGFPEIKKNIFFPGMLNGSVKWAAIFGCEAFILPSHQENFGIAVVEALACGKPVLISNQVNIWQEIKAEGAGLVGPDTVSGILKILNLWINLNPQQRTQMGEDARLAYEKYFKIEYAVKKLMSKIG